MNEQGIPLLLPLLGLIPLTALLYWIKKKQGKGLVILIVVALFVALVWASMHYGIRVYDGGGLGLAG